MIVASEAIAWSMERQALKSLKSQDEHEKQQRENKYRIILNLQRLETHIIPIILFSNLNWNVDKF